MIALKISEKVSQTIRLDTRDKEGETSVTSLTHLRGLLSIARESFVESSINWALSLPFFTSQRSIYPFSYRRTFFSRQSTLFSFPPSFHRLISIQAKSCRQPHPRDSVATCSCSSRIKSGKDFLLAETNQSRTQNCIKWLQFLRSVHSEVSIS